MRRPGRLTALLLAGFVVSACTDPTVIPPAGKVFSVIDPDGLPPSNVGIALPDTVPSGASLAVPFYTWGSSSCTVAAGEDVSAAGQTITITSYDAAIPAGTPCTRDLRQFERRTTVQAPAGEVTFHLRGRRLGADPSDEPITLSRTVVVLP